MLLRGVVIGQMEMLWLLAVTMYFLIPPTKLLRRQAGDMTPETKNAD
jgi:hypothetical protein